MNSTNPSQTPPKPWLGIFWGGLACGILDITSAIVGYGFRGVPPIRILQSVAAGALGRDSFNGGAKTAALGLFFHFLIAFTASSVFYIASRKITFLTLHPVISGLLYGEAVFLFMHFVVIPLSASIQGPVRFSWAFLIAGPLGHPFFVGLPISLAVSRFAKKAA
jgi:uncharacterized membrane protein YagU involved in acid resistance